ncbi:MAG: TonB-dependent receptor [Chitinophagales bacterium]|nr:TonB-dependent receptor [Chitinophagales bacterium]
MSKLLIIAALLSSFSLFGQQGDTIQAVDTLSSPMLQSVTVIATRATEHTPTTYVDVDKEQLQKLNLAQDMPVLLEQTPSVVTTSDAGAGVGYTGLRIRGSDQSRINVTINGIPYNDPETQAVFWVNLPDLSSSVENIQIQRGVGTSTNGAGAFGGTINIQTAKVASEAYGQISGSYGSFNTWKASGQFGTGLIKDKFGFQGRFSKIHSDGYVDRASSDLTSFFITGGFFGKRDAVRINVFSGKEVTYQSWYGVDAVTLDTNRTYNFAGTEKPGEPYDKQVDNYRQDHYQLIYTRQISPRILENSALHYTRGYGYYEEYKASQPFDTYGLQPVVLGTDSIFQTDLIRRLWLDNHFFGGVYSLAYDDKKRFAFTFGGGWNQFLNKQYGELVWAQYASNSNHGDHFYKGDAQKNDLNIYFKTSYRPVGSLYLFLDLQYRNVNYLVGGIDARQRQLSVNDNLHFFNPKVGLSYRLKQRHHFYTSFAIANREPIRTDYVDAPTGIQPKPEHLNNLEAGYSFRTTKYTVSANYYLMHYKNQLVLTGELNEVGTPIRTNVDHSYRTGIELQTTLQPLEQLRIEGNATWSMNKIKTFHEVLYAYDEHYTFLATVVNTYSNTDISFSPSWIAGATITAIPATDFEIALYTKYVGKQYLDNTSNNARSLDGYVVNNLRLSYTLHTKFVKALRFDVLVNNLFNVRYESNGYTYSELYDIAGERSRGDYNYYYPQAGINILGGITLHF